MSNYNYYYLKNLLKKSNKNVENLFVGSSYSRNGLDDKLLDNSFINLSLCSQDLYFLIQLANHIIKNNRNIKKIFLGLGYYAFYHDLSKSTNGGIERINNVYGPILDDYRNVFCESVRNSSLFLERYQELINFDKAEEIFEEIIFKYLGES